MILSFNYIYKYIYIGVCVIEKERKIFLQMGLQKEQLEEAIFIFLL